MKNQVDTFKKNDSAESSACSRFVEQARLVIPLDRVEVVLLQDEVATSQVVFRWPEGVSGANQPSSHDPALNGSSPNLQAALTKVPLYCGGRQIGEVLCWSQAVPGFSPEELGLLHQLAAQLATRLENADLVRRLQAREEEIRAVDQIAKMITSASNID